VRRSQSGKKVAQRHQLFSRVSGFCRSPRFARRNAVLYRPGTQRSVSTLFRKLYFILLFIFVSNMLYQLGLRNFRTNVLTATLV